MDSVRRGCTLLQRCSLTLGSALLVYNATLANITSYDASYDTSLSDATKIPTGFCSTGFHTLYLAFAFALVIDVILQVYAWFMLWRFKARLEGYFAFKSTQGGAAPALSPRPVLVRFS